MLPRYSNISLEAFNELNAFALSDSPSAAENFSRRCAELGSDSALSGLGMLRKDGCLLLADLTIPSINHYVECEALLHFPEDMQHPVEQVSACLSLLRRQEIAQKLSGCPEPTTIPMPEVQRRLSHLLVQYPVLMDYRMLIGVVAPEDDWVPVAHAIAETSFASLPRLIDGLSEKQLRLFAANRCVKSGLNRTAPNAGKTRSSVRGKTPQAVAFNGGSVPAVAGASRGAFLLSLLRLDAYSKDMTGRGVVTTDTADRDNLYRALSRVVWDVALTGGQNSNVTRDELISAAQLRSPFAKSGKDTGSDDEYDLTVATASGAGGGGMPQLLYHMANNVDHQLFGAGSSFVSAPGEQPRFSSDEMLERTRAAIATLVDVKVHASPADAAAWLARVVVGDTRTDAVTVGPVCQPEAALGFLRALHENGAAVCLNNVEQVTSLNAQTSALAGGYLPQSGHQKRALQAAETWRLAVEVFGRTVAMEGVYERHAAAASAAVTESPGEGPSGVPGDAPGQRPHSEAVLRARARRASL